MFSSFKPLKPLSFKQGAGATKDLESRVSRLEQLGGNDADPIGYEIIRVKYTHWGEYVYFADFVVSFGDSIAKDNFAPYVNRMWANGILIYDRSAAYVAPVTPPPYDYTFNRTLIVPTSGGPVAQPIPAANPLFTFYDGNENQGEVYRGMHYRGLMTARFINFDLTNYGNTIPAITAEIVDGGASVSDSGTSSGTLIGAYASNSPNTELHSEYDALWRMFHRSIGQGVLAPRVERERLSSKLQSFNAGLGDAALNADVGDTAQIDESYTTFIPALNQFVSQLGNDPAAKLVFELLTGQFVTAISGQPEWDGVVSFSVNNGAYTDYTVIGANATGAFNILRLKDRELTLVDNGTVIDPPKTIIRGEAREGETDVYLLTETDLVRLVVTQSGVADQASIYSPSGGNTLEHGYFDPTAKRVIVLEGTGGGAGVVRALHGTTGAVAWTSAAVTLPPAKGLHAQTEEATSDLSGGSLVFALGAGTVSVNYVDLVAGLASVIVVPGAGTIVADYPTIWDSRTQTIYGPANKYVSIGVFLDPDDDPNRYTAGDVMRAYAIQAGFNTVDIDTVNMDDMYIDGYVVSSQTSLGMLATALGQLYGFNWTERAGEIVFKGNYDSDGDLVIDGTAPFERLAFISDGADAQQYINILRRSDQSLPAKLTLSYFDGQNDYREGFQRAERGLFPVTMESHQSQNWSYPLTINGNYALQLLTEALYRMWATKVTFALRLPAEGIILDAGDILEFTANGFTYQAVISRHRINGDFSVSLDLIEAATANYPIAVTTQPSVQVPTGVPQPVRVVILDIPSTSEDQNSPSVLNLLVLMAGYTPGRFRGATFDMADFQIVVAQHQEAYIGTMLESFEEWPYPFELDTLNNLYVDLGTIPATKMVAATSGELDADPLLNLVALGSGSEVELVQFMDVEQIDATTYRLYNLRRGRFGTEVFMFAQMGGNPVSFLDNAQLIQYEYDDYFKGVQYTYRAYTPTQQEWQVDALPFTPEGNSRKPYAPINIEVVREDGTNDLVFSWTRRARFYNSPPTDFNTSPPLDEVTEAYQIDVYLGNIVVRSLLSSNTNVAYTEAEQLADGFIGDELSIEVAVYQRSVETIGNGFGDPIDYPIYPVDVKRLTMRMSLGGAMETNVVLAPVEVVTLEASFALGGEMATNIYGPVLLEMSFDGGGSMTTAILEPVKLAAVFDGGGTMLTNIREPVFMGMAFGLGGEMATNLVVGAMDVSLITVPAASAFETLTNYPLFIDLSTLGAGFWSTVKSDGSDMRAWADAGLTTQLSLDLIDIDTALETGYAFVLVPTLSNVTDNEVYITVDGIAAAIPVGDPFGAYSVWADYAVVYWPIGGQYNRKNGVAPTVIGTAPGMSGEYATFAANGGLYWDAGAFNQVHSFGGQVYSNNVGGNNDTVAMYSNGSATTSNWSALATFEGTPDYGMWNSTNAWLKGGTPVNGVPVIWHSGMNGSTQRRIRVEAGVAVGLVSATAARPSSGQTFILANDTTANAGSQRLNGGIRWAYLKLGVYQSTGWIDTEHHNIDDPAAFYTVS